MSEQRSSAPDPGFPAGPAAPLSGDAGNGHDALLSLAREHANLGLPVAPSERFRLVKRLVARVGWRFLRHQIAFNEATIEAIRELSAHVSRLEQGVKDDLLDFADRSASQAQAEITDQVAEARSVQADLILEFRTLQAELDGMRQGVPLDRPPFAGDGDGDGATERR